MRNLMRSQFATLSSCADLSDLDLSEWIISYIGIQGLRKTVQINNACINMYEKSGNTQKVLGFLKT